MDYRIPLFDLNYDEREEAAVREVIRSRWISTGPRTAEFESRFAAALGARHAVAVANCTVALHLALRLVGVGEGDEVICPSLTFVATVNAIRYVGAVPVFCDVVGVDDLTLDPARLERLVTSRTRAVVVMHYAGFPCDMLRILDFAHRHGLRVVEDACHGPTSELEGRKLGTWGDVGCFSFFSNKNLSTGEGGMLVTADDQIAARARLLRSHGMTSLSYERAKGHATAYDVLELGYNYRMDDLHSALGIVQLEKLPGDLRRREEIRQLYLRELASVEQVIVPFRARSGFVSNYIFPVVLRSSTCQHRDAVREELARHGIQTSVHYPAVHRFSIYRDLPAELPNTEYVTDNEITLPMFASLRDDQVREVVGVLSETVARHDA